MLLSLRTCVQGDERVMLFSKAKTHQPLFKHTQDNDVKKVCDVQNVLHEGIIKTHIPAALEGAQTGYTTSEMSLLKCMG